MSDIFRSKEIDDLMRDQSLCKRMVCELQYVQNEIRAGSFVGFHSCLYTRIVRW